MKGFLLLAAACLALSGCKPPDPVVGSMERKLEVTDRGFSKVTWFSFRDVETGYQFNWVSTGQPCGKGARWKVGTRVLLTVVTYQGEKGQYQVLPRSEAWRMCR